MTYGNWIRGLSNKDLATVIFEMAKDKYLLEAGVEALERVLEREGANE